MAATAVTGPGQADGAGSRYALFLQRFGGEVLSQFQRRTITEFITTVRSISDGESAQFPAHGRVNAKFHTAGANIIEDAGILENLLNNERVISIDQLLIAPIFVDSLEEMMNHWDIRGPYARELGGALARELDEQVISLCYLAAQAAATVSGGDGGTVLTNANAGTVSSALEDELFAAAQALDDNDVPGEDRFAVMSPAQYYLLVRDSTGGPFSAVDKRFTTLNGGFDDGVVKQLAGFTLLKSTSHTTIVAGGGPTAGNGRNTYDGTYTNSVAACVHKSAVGTVKMTDVAVEVDRKSEYQGTLMLAKAGRGSNILRPESAVEIQTA